MFYHHGFHHWALGPFAFHSPLGFLATLLVWGLAAFVLYQLINLMRRPVRVSSDAAMDILRQRLARGEISQAEFDAIRERL